jgi:hypothetical protein
MRTASSRTRTCLVGLLVLASSVVVSTAPSAPQAVAASALPASVVPPPAGNGVPFGSAAAGGSAGVDLASVGYVEEEYIVGGSANVYRYGAGGAVEVQTADVPYATRILVRRPADPRRFSGNVEVETSHPQYGVDVVWAQTFDYVVANGDAYVSITTRRTSGSSAIDVLKSFDPVRYAPIDFREDGLNWDVIGQVGHLLKTSIRANPLHGYDVERLYATGWSGGGALLLLYISDGFHGRARVPDGAPIFDGYLVGEPSGYPRINSSAPTLATDDPRQKVQPRDVPAISLHTRPQEQFRRRADGNEQGDRYRVYEVAGAAHVDFRLAGDVACGYEVSRFPMHHLFKSTLARLDAWAVRDVTPPVSRRIALDADGSAMLDEHGNPRGGVRTTYTDVPTARYFDIPGCSLIGAQERFSTEKLLALYRNHGGYVNKVVVRAKALERDGWLLPADARAVRREAAAFGGI